MELALITAQQVAVLFLLIGTGMVAVKTGVLKLENKQALSNLLVYIIVPAMVVNSYRMEFSAQILRNLLAAFGMSVLSVLLGIPHAVLDNSYGKVGRFISCWTSASNVTHRSNSLGSAINWAASQATTTSRGHELAPSVSRASL